MTRQLILMRHAKSDWGDDSLPDHQRPLNRRGSGDAPLMGHWLADTDRIPDRILCSSSVRTRQTLAGMLPTWSAEPIVSYHEELYHASAEGIIALIQAEDPDASALLIIAHNPGMSHLVSHFANRFTEMPTAAIAVFCVACSAWQDLQPDSDVTLVDQVKPKALK